MAINVRRTLNLNTEIYFYGEEGYILRCMDNGEMDDIAERVCEILVKHHFSYAEVFSATSGELIMEIERS